MSIMDDDKEAVLISLAALTFHDAVVMLACNQERASNGDAPAYGLGCLLNDAAFKLDQMLRDRKLL